jgi:biopolymer transport protein ExbD
MGAAVGVGKGPRSDINITPLVDVVLVLLIIFMVLTPLMEKELSVRVPEEPDKNQIVPPPDPNDIPDQWVLRVDAEGKFLLNNNVLKDEDAVEELKKVYRIAKANEAKNGPPVVFFDADDKAKYVRAVKALDAIRDSAPNWVIGMMTESPALPAAPAAPGAPGAPGAVPAPPQPPAPPAPPQ